MKTRHLQLVSQEHSVTTRTRSTALSPFGPVSPGSTTLLAQETLRANQEAQLLELLNSLERKITEANTKSCEVLNIFLHGTTHLVEPIVSYSEKTIIK